ncbi:MSF transporter [Candidatus Cyrtobacter comes]|uniref:Lysosomal dipeptide transporter MFSD1 n=1 Tax=Candidatus Cyrtobacter comes TaxID=675776 RepID=A0ABU5L740_9RICK|nr:MFS transporter [Candidatus Cyrtobacter comes]MDZ5761938.1 MSF transporter [Candidatus Cyrtobacter comes]
MRVFGLSMWLSATIFLAYQYVLRVLPNLIVGPLSANFGISSQEMGYFSSLYYIGYTGMHIPIGILLDRIGVRKVMPICIALTSVALVPLIYSNSWHYAVAGRLLLGMASSAAVLSVFRVTRICFGEKHFSTAIGITVTIGILGAVYGGRPVDILVEQFSWKSVINIFIIAGFVIALLSYIFIPSTKRTDNVPQSNRSIADDLRVVCLNPRIILLSSICGLMVGLLEGFADAWGTLFFEQAYGLDRGTTTMLPSIIFFGMCVGSPIIGYFIEKTRCYYTGIVFSGIAMLCCFSAILYLELNTFMLYFCVFTSGFFCAFQVIVISKVRDFARKELLDMTSTVSNMVIMIYGFVFHNIIGGLMDMFKDSDGLASAYSLRCGLSSINIALVLGIAITLLMMFYEKKKGRSAL